MRELLRLLQATGGATLLPARWRAEAGEAAFALLSGEGLLEDAGQAERYPCPSGGEGCPRLLTEREGGHLAYCANIPAACADVLLAPAELRLLRLRPERLLGLLQRQLGLSGELQPDPLLDRTFVLGRRTWRGQEREVVATFAANSPGFPSYLASRQAVRGPALVLVPTRGRLPAELVRAYLAGAATELVFLDELLRLEGGQLRVAGELAPSEPAFCVALERSGTRPVSAAEYRRLCAQAAEYDLFIDLCSGTQTIRCGRRAKRRFEEATLSASEAGALARLVEATPRALRLSDLCAVAAKDKLFTRARAKVDLAEAGRWRSFRAAGGEKRDRLVVFDPPEGLRYLVLKLG